jgi:hypothetical protein
MGWNSWNTFQGGVSAAVLRETADLFVSLGLRDAGYVFVNTDDEWLNHARTSDGRLQPKSSFGGEAGIRNLSSYIHKLKLKFGIYLAAATTTCAGGAGGLYHEKQDAQTFAEWQVDYLKYDNCGEIDLNSYAKFQTMRDALNDTGRLIEYSFEPHIYRGPTAVVAEPNASVFEGPFVGVPEPGSSNHYCGTCCGAPKLQPAMCNGSTCGHNSMLNVSLTEMMRRCAADPYCAGFANDTSAKDVGADCWLMSPGPNHFRAVKQITSINRKDPKWMTWRKRNLPTPPPSPPPAPAGPTTYSWLPLVGNSWRSGNDIGSQFQSIFRNLITNNAWSTVTGPGAWADAGEF